MARFDTSQGIQGPGVRASGLLQDAAALGRPDGFPGEIRHPPGAYDSADGTRGSLSADGAVPHGHASLRRLSSGQALALEIIEALLRTREPDTDAAIDHALARLGTHLGCDRTYVMRLRGDGRMDNTHEWVAEGVTPEIDRLQGVPVSGIAHWFDALERDEAVEIPDAAALPEESELRKLLDSLGIRALLVVPMRTEGRLTGFAGYDSVRRTRRLLPGEVALLRSVANAIDRVLNGREARRQGAAASAALAEETARLRATLAAVPDLVLELDAAGRIVGHHASANFRLAAPPETFLGRRPAEVLPPHVGAIADRMMREIDANGYSRAQPYRLDLPDGRRWFSATGARRVVAGAGSGFVIVVRDITHLHRQKLEIERLGDVARRTTNLVAMTDAERRIDWVNAAWERRRGEALSALRGRRLEAVLAGSARKPEDVLPIAAALDAGRQIRAELCSIARDGETIWVDLDIQPLHDQEGRLQGFMAMGVDITAAKAQSAALAAAAAEAERARAALVSAVEALRYGFAWYDADDRLVLCNERYRQLDARVAPKVRPGANYAELLREGLRHGVYAKAAGHEEAWLAARLALHRQPESETEIELSDGRCLRLVERATPDSGRVGLWVDITALKEAAQQALAERAAAMDASLDGIALTDATGRFRYMNTAWRRLFAVGEHEATERLDWRRLYAPEDAARLEAAVWPVMQAQGSWRGEVVARRRDGELLELEAAATLRPDGGSLVIMRDISARRRADQERARLREALQLAQRREVIGHLAAGLAHDFNNLLATIDGSAALAQATLAPLAPAQPHLARIQAATRQAAALVRRLLRLGERASRRSRIDLRGSLHEAADLLGTGPGPDLRLRLDLPPEPAHAWADPTDVLQVLLNLLLNARDAVGEAGGEILLSLARAAPEALAGPFVAGGIDAGARDRPHWAISVADTGRGMNPDQMRRLLRPFVSTKGAAGNGLGLAIVAGVVAANAAALSVETAPGRGTRFTVLWPAASEADAPDPGPQVAPAPASRTHPAPAEARVRDLAGRAILVVEDSPALLEVLTAFLEGAGARVAGTTDPGDALEVLRESPGLWDLLITDFDMAPVDGAALAAEVRRLAPALPVLLVTALPDWRGLAGRQPSGFAAVLAKPVTREGLIAAAAAALEGTP